MKKSSLYDMESVELETINLYRKLLKIEQYEMFLFGGREMYNYFKSIGIID